MGRRWHRGGGLHARAAAVPACSSGGRCPLPQRASDGDDRYRPRSDPDRDAQKARRGQQVRRVLRHRTDLDVGAGSRDALQHVAGVRRHRLAVPDRRANARVPARLGSRPRAHRPGRAVREGTGHLPHGRLGDSDLQRDGGTRPGERGPERCRAEAPAGSRRAPERLGLLHERLGAAAPTRDQRGHGRGRGATARRGRRYRPQRPCGTADAGRSLRRRPRPRRLGGHRRDHVMHQYVQPRRDGRRRFAGAQRRCARPDAPGLRQDVARARIESRHRLPRARGAADVTGAVALQPRRLRLHDVHRQQRTASRERRRTHRRRGSGCRGGAQRQSELRGPHPSPGQGRIPRVAAAGGGIRARGASRHRPEH